MPTANGNILDLIILLGALQGIILAGFLWREARFLSLFILGFAANSLFYLTEAFGLRQGLTFYEFLPLYCSLFTIGCFGLFVTFTVQPERKPGARDGWWLLPAAVQTLFQLGFLTLFLVREAAVYEWLLRLGWVYDLLDLTAVILGLTVLVRALLQIRKYEADLRKNYADIAAVSLGWLRKLIVALFAVWLLFAIPTIYEQISGLPSPEIFYPLWLATSVLIYWIGYSAYRHREVFGVRMFHEEEKAPALSERTEVYHQDLIRLMETERPWLEPTLNLKSLAASLGISGGYLSQIINQYEGKNFFDFVNGYRVRRVVELFGDEDYAHLNLLGLAFEAGFRSKSTFNLAFKKLTGSTPTAFRKGLKTS